MKASIKLYCVLGQFVLCGCKYPEERNEKFKCTKHFNISSIYIYMCVCVCTFYKQIKNKESVYSFRVVILLEVNLVSGDRLPRLSTTCRSKFIAWCLRRLIEGIPTGSRIFAPTANEYRFERSPHHKTAWQGGMSDKSNFTPHLGQG